MANRDEILRDYFLTIHKIILRSIKTSFENVQNFIDSGIPNEQTCQGLFTYITLTSLMLDTHHCTEDDIAFPYFENSLPDTHFEWLHEDHDLITGFLDELAPILETLKKTGTTLEKLQDLKDVLLKIEDRWDQHYGLEEEEFINLIDSLDSYENRVKLIEQFFEYNKNLIKPYYLSLPFMLYNLEKEDRERWSKGYSPELLNQVETVAWKDKWIAMMPFLLQ